MRYPAVHVVGTNGKSTTTRLTEALLADAGLAVGAYFSPHVRGWSERIRIGGERGRLRARRRRACGRAAERLGATQFEALTAAALAAFAEAGVDVAVVEAGLGGRHDATNVLATRVVVLTNVALEHMDVLGDTREAIAAEKLAVVQSGRVVVLGEPEWERARAPRTAPRASIVTAASNLALAVAAAEAFLGRASTRAPRRTSRCPAGSSIAASGRSRSGTARTTSPASAISCRACRTATTSIVASILADKRPELMLEALSVLGRDVRRDASRRMPRSLAGSGARRARAEPYFEPGRGRSPIPAPPAAARSRSRARRRRCSSRARSIFSPSSSGHG